MAWTAGVTRTTGDLITAAQWNSFLGASGSLDYLKVEVDKLDDCAYNPTPSRALDTVYQNTSGKIRIVAVEGRMNILEVLNCYIGTSTAALGDVGMVSNEIESGTAGDYTHGVVTFVVPPSYYYKASTEGTGVSLQEWKEWDLH